MNVRSAWAAFALASLTACSGAGTTLPGLPALPAAGAATKSTSSGVRISVTVPARLSATARARVRLSPASKSITLVISALGPTPISLLRTLNLLPSSRGCAPKNGGAVCEVVVELPPGRWHAEVQTFDRVGGKGTSLSSGSISFRVKRNAVSPLPLVLWGIPHSLTVTPGAYAVHGTQGGGFTLYGTQAQPVIVNALDADGQTIVGPGAPAFHVALANGAGWSVAAPAPAQPNVFAITPPAVSGATAAFQVTATGTGCNQADATCSGSFNATNHLQLLFVGPYGTNEPTYMFSMPYTAAPTKLQGSTGATTFATNSSGDLFVLDQDFGGAGSILEYSPPYTGAPIAHIAVPNALTIAIDKNDALYVGEGNYGGTPGIAVFTPPYSGTPTLITNGNDGPWSLAFDAHGDLFAGGIVEYSPPFTSSSSPVATFPSGGGLGGALAVDAMGNVITGDGVHTQIDVFSPPFTNATIASATMQRACCLPPQAFAFDDDGNLWAAETAILDIGTEGTVIEYPSSYSNTPIRGFTTPAKTLAIDGAGNLVTLDGGQSANMWEVSPPYTAPPKLLATGMGGGTTSQAIFLTP